MPGERSPENARAHTEPPITDTHVHLNLDAYDGDREDVKKLFLLVGRSEVADIFIEQISSSRCNYRTQTVNFL